jgi:hypothetical protein
MVINFEDFIFNFEDWSSLSWTLWIAPKGRTSGKNKIKMRLKLKIIL